MFEGQEETGWWVWNAMGKERVEAVRVGEWVGARPHSTWGWWGETEILFQMQWEL